MSVSAIACPSCGGSGGGPFGPAGSAWDVDDYVCPRCAGSGRVQLDRDGTGADSVRPGLAKPAMRAGEDAAARPPSKRTA